MTDDEVLLRRVLAKRIPPLSPGDVEAIVQEFREEAAREMATLIAESQSEALSRKKRVLKKLRSRG